MQTITTLKRTEVEIPNQPNSIDILINKKEYDILTEDCLCIIDEVEFVKIIDITTQTPLPVMETTQPTATLLPHNGVSKFFSRLWNRLTVLPLTMPLCLVMMFGLFVGNGWGQINITAGGSAITQNFNSLGTSSTATLPTDWTVQKSTSARTIPNFSSIATAVELAGGNSIASNAGNGIYRFNANNSTTESAIGGLSSSSASKSVVLYSRLINNSSIPISSFSISYNVEKYRNGTNSAGYTIEMFYSTDGTSWTSCGTDFTTSFAADANSNGFATSPGSSVAITNKAYTPASSISQNSVFYFAWRYSVTSGTTTSNAQAIGVDDISITAFGTPAAPTISSITPGNQQLSVAFTAGSDGGSAITNYKYSTDGGTNWQTRSTGTTASPLVISTLSTDGTTALTNGTSYNVQIRAVNAVGDGTATASTAATPRTTPSAPTITGITPGNQQLSVAFTAGSDGGSAITTYKYSTNGGINWQTRASGTTASPLLISTLSTDGTTALTNGVSYDIQIRAVNAAGDGTATGTTQGTPAAPVSPTLNPVTLASALSTTYGTASAGVSFAVGGSNLTSTITVTPQSGYEIATSSSGTYQSTAMTGIANGSTLWVRFSSTISAGDKNNTTAVVLTGGGASTSADVTTSSSGNTVSQKALTITGLTAQNKVYDALTTATTTGTAALTGVVSPDAVTLSGTPSFTFATAAVGNSIAVSTSGYTLSGAQSANYSLTQPSFTANITARSLTVTANNVSKYAGVALTGGAGSTAFTSSGLQNGETIGSVTIAYGSAGLATGDGNTVGVYASQVTPSAATSGTFTASNYSISYVAGSITVLETPITIASWNFNGESSPATSTADVSNANLTSAPILSRGSGAASNGAGNSFRTTGFSNNGISTSNTDYFQTSIVSSSSTISLATIDAKFAGTASFYASPGVTSQFAYSLDGTNFTLIGSAQQSTALTLSQIDLSGISALQNVAAGTTIILRYYASGQTTTGGWGFTSASSNSSDDGLIIQGYVKSLPVLSTPTATSIATTSATLGATVTSDGGASITARGTVYGTSASPTTNLLAEGGTTVAAYTHSRTGLTANTLYYYRGYATNSVGTGYSADGSFTTLHNAPTVGSGSNATATTIDASWTAPSGGSEVFTYEIQVDNDNDFSSTIYTQNNISSGTTTHTATGLASNTTYYFRVRANNAAGSSAWSSTSSGYNTLEAVTPTISGMLLTAFGNVCINTTTSPNSFTINGSALTSADVTVSSLSGFTFSTTSGGTYTSSLTLSQAGGTYAQDIYVKFTPTAVQSYGGNIVIGGGGATSVNVAVSGSGISGSVAVTTTAASAITSTGASTGGSSVSTTCGTITAKGVAYGTSANPTTPVTSDGTGTGNFTSTLSGLTPNTLYNYRAYATNSNSVTSYGSGLTFTTLHNAPTVGTGSNPETTGFTANWSAPLGGGSETFTYEVAISTSSSFASTLSTQSGISSGTTSYQFTGLSSGTSYYFRVRANNAGGSSDWSAISTSITTLTPWENFEIGSSTTYNETFDVQISSRSWYMLDVFSGSTVGSDRFFGTKSLRIRNTGIAAMNFDVTNGISSLTIYHAKYGTDANSTWRLEVSNNSGISWDAYVSSDITTSSTTLTAQTFNVDLCGSLRFRIVKRSGGASRINIDDIVLVEKAATPSAPSASAQSFCSASSPTVASLTVTTGSNIQWYDASTNGNLLASNTSIVTGTYYASQTVSGCESTTRASVSVTINSSGTWIGDSNDDWNIAGNWCGGVPNSSSASVSIPSGITVNLDASPSLLNLTIGSGSVVNASDNTLSISNGGTFTNNGSFNSETSEVVFLGTGSIGGTNPVTFNNLTLNGNVTINTTPTVSGILQLNSGANVLNKVINYGASGQLYYNQSGTINATSFEWPITNKPSQVAVYNNTEVLLNENKSISGSLNLANGKVNLGSYHLTLETSATISTGGFSSARMVIAEGDGELRKRFTAGSSNPSEFIFPVGTKTGAVEYTPVHLDFSSASFGPGAYVGVKVRNTKNMALNSGVTNYLDRNWIVEPYDITDYTYKIQLYYNQNDFVTDGSLAEGNLIPIKISSGQWYQPTDGTFSNATSQGTGTVFPSNDYLEWNNLISFSEFGGAGGSNQPLPVELVSFNASCIENQTVLSWQTASEQNASHFEIEKSTDGMNWRVIGQVQAAGNSIELLNYNFVDNDKSNAYYRLNQLDIDGKNEYFGPISSSCEKIEFNVSSFPNPSEDNFWIKIESDKDQTGNYTIIDLNGNSIYSADIQIQKGINLFLVNKSLHPGIYHIEVTNEKQISTSIKHIRF